MAERNGKLYRGLRFKVQGAEGVWSLGLFKVFQLAETREGRHERGEKHEQVVRTKET